MPSGLDVLQAVSATLHVATQLVVLLRAYQNAPTAITSLAARLDDDISLLGDLKSVFNGVDGRNSHILASDDAYEHIQKVVNHIKPLLQETIRKVEGIERGPKSIAARARWLVVGGDLEKAERDLFEWSQRLSVRLTLLPYQIKLIFDQKQADSPFSVLKAQTTMEMYQRFQSMPSRPAAQVMSFLLPYSTILALRRSEI